MSSRRVSTLHVRSSASDVISSGICQTGAGPISSWKAFAFWKARSIHWLFFSTSNGTRNALNRVGTTISKPLFHTHLKPYMFRLFTDAENVRELLVHRCRSQHFEPRKRRGYEVLFEGLFWSLRLTRAVTVRLSDLSVRVPVQGRSTWHLPNDLAAIALANRPQYCRSSLHDSDCHGLE
jgi:hypothetical protein